MLWEGNKPAFEIFKLCRLYLTESLRPDPSLVQMLVDSRNKKSETQLDLETILLQTVLIMAGYTKIVHPTKTKDEGI